MNIDRKSPLYRSVMKSRRNFYNRYCMEDFLDESCISGEFQRAAPGKRVKIISKHTKKSLGKKDKYNTLGENMRTVRSRKLKESSYNDLDFIVQGLEGLVQQNCPELKGCLDSYLLSLRSGDFGDISEISQDPDLYTPEYFYEDFIEYVKTILSGAEDYLYS